METSIQLLLSGLFQPAMIYQAAETTNPYHGTRIEIVAKMISKSHLGLNSDRKRLSFHLQQANGAILNWLENAHNENALKGLIRETLNPKNYQQRKPAAVETWGAGGRVQLSDSLPRFVLLGDFSVKFATVEFYRETDPVLHL